MKGDYFRYIAEFTEGEGKTGAANSAHDACALFGISEAARLGRAGIKSTFKTELTRRFPQVNIFALRRH